MLVDYLENHNMRAISASGRQEMAVSEPSLVLLEPVCVGRPARGPLAFRRARDRPYLPRYRRCYNRYKQSFSCGGSGGGDDDRQQAATLSLHGSRPGSLDLNRSRVFAASSAGRSQSLQAGADDRDTQHLPLLFGELRDHHVQPRRQGQKRQVVDHPHRR